MEQGSVSIFNIEILPRDEDWQTLLAHPDVSQIFFLALQAALKGLLSLRHIYDKQCDFFSFT